MELGGTTWIVAADREHARVFEEKVLAGDVHELVDLAMRGDDVHGGARHHTGTVHDRHGAGRHGAGDHAADDEIARAFFGRLVEKLEAAERRGAFDSLVLMAPPRALGLLKGALSKALEKKLIGTDPHECVQERAEKIRTRLHKVRAKG